MRMISAPVPDRDRPDGRCDNKSAAFLPLLHVTWNWTPEQQRRQPRV